MNVFSTDSSCNGGPTGIAVIPTDATCGDNGSIALGAVTGGVSPYTYSIDGSPFKSATIFNDLKPGIHTIVVKDANGCTFSIDVNVIGTGFRSIVVIPTPATCGQNNGSFILGGNYVTFPVLFSVDGSLFTNKGTYLNLAAGDHIVIVRDALGCTLSTIVNLTNIDGPTAIQIVATPTSCGYSNGSLSLDSVKGGVAPYTYSVDGSSYTSTTIYNSITAGLHKVDVKDANGCIFDTSVNVIGSSAPPAPIVTVINNCATSILTAGNIVNGAALLWSTGSTANSITVGIVGTYTVTQTINGCTSTLGSGIASPNTSPNITISGGTFCATGTTTLIITGATGGTFTASPGGLSINSGTGVIDLATSTPGTYTITYSFGTAPCNGSTTSTVIVNLKPLADAPANVTSYTSYILPPLNIGAYYSSPNGVGPIPVGTTIATTQTIYVYAGTVGCSDEHSFVVAIIPSGLSTEFSEIFIPKAFSPNGDGHNDKLTPLLFRIKEFYYFRVFNRWGQLVFETRIMGEGWDGTLKGVKLSPGVYTWTASGIDADGKTLSKRGQTVLLK